MLTKEQKSLLALAHAQTLTAIKLVNQTAMKLGQSADPGIQDHISTVVSDLESGASGLKRILL